MKTKMKLAHEYMQNTLNLLRKHDIPYDFESLIEESYEYAEAMIAEDDKRTNQTQEEWQPDWSQAPDDAVAWVYSNVDKSGFWCHKKPIRLSRGWCTSTMLKKSPSFNYQDHWKDSLRERPE